MLSSWPRTVGSTAKRLQLVGAPTAEPISFDLVKSALKMGNVDTSSFALQAKLAAARSWAEGELHRCLVQQTWDLFLDDEAYVGTGGLLGRYPGYGASHELGLTEIQLPLPPTQAVLGVFTTDNTGLETPADPRIYSVTRSKEPCRVRLNPGYFWPPHRGYEGVRIRFTAGYVVPVQIAPDGSEIRAWGHGYQSGDIVRFSSYDGTLPQPLVIRQNYLVTNLSETGFQVTDMAGNLIYLSTDAALGWNGTLFLGEIPAEVLEAVVLACAMPSLTEPKSRMPGVKRQTKEPAEEMSVSELQNRIAKHIWPFL